MRPENLAIPGPVAVPGGLKKEVPLHGIPRWNLVKPLKTKRWTGPEGPVRP